MATTDARNDVLSTGSSPFGAQRFSGWPERRAVLRWAALLALGVLALPFYGGILQVAGTFLDQPGTFFWPLLAVTLCSTTACWLVLRSFPAAGRWARWIELGLILALGLAARAIFWGAPPT